MKLGQITAKGSTEGCMMQPIVGKSDAKAVKAEMQRLNKVKSINTQFRVSEKNIGISRDNQILLSKLVEISNGKMSSIPKLPKLKDRNNA